MEMTEQEKDMGVTIASYKMIRKFQGERTCSLRTVWTCLFLKEMENSTATLLKLPLECCVPLAMCPVQLTPEKDY